MHENREYQAHAMGLEHGSRSLATGVSSLCLGVLISLGRFEQVEGATVAESLYRLLVAIHTRMPLLSELSRKAPTLVAFPCVDVNSTTPKLYC